MATLCPCCADPYHRLEAKADRRKEPTTTTVVDIPSIRRTVDEKMTSVGPPDSPAPAAGGPHPTTGLPGLIVPVNDHPPIPGRSVPGPRGAGGELREPADTLAPTTGALMSGLPRLFARAAFSNLPVIDCHYLPDGYGKTSRFQRLLYGSVEAFCRVILFFDIILCTLFRLSDWLYCGLNVFAVLLCYRLNLTCDYSFQTVLLNLLIFPLAFTVTAAYSRRESALTHWGTFKGSAHDMYLQYRCWQFLPDLPVDFLDCSRACILQLFTAARG